MKIVNIFMIASLAVLAGCKETLSYDTVNTDPPVVTDFSPRSGIVGSEVTIYGENLFLVDTIHFGDGLAELKYKINSREIVARTLTSSRSGQVTVSSKYGESSTPDSYTIGYPTPVVTSMPSSGKLNETITITGTSLDAVLAVYFDDTPATIISQKPASITLSVPFTDETDVSVTLAYFNGSAEVRTAGRPFTLTILTPTVSTWPTEVEAGAEFEVTGTNLDQIDQVRVGGVVATITKVSEGNTKMTVLVSNNYTAEAKVQVTLYYHGGQMLSRNNVDLVLNFIYYRKNVKIYGTGHASASIYSINLNRYFTACEVKDICDDKNADVKPKDLQLMATGQGQGVTIGALCKNNLGLNNLSCNGSSLASYNTKFRGIRFRRLSTTDPIESKYIDSVKNGKLINFTISSLAEAGLSAGGSAANWKTVARNRLDNTYNTTDFEGLAVGGVTVFLIRTGDFSGDELNVGFLYLKEIARSNTATAADANTVLTLDVLMSKDKD